MADVICGGCCIRTNSFVCHYYCRGKIPRSIHSPSLRDVGSLIANPRIIAALLMTVLGFGGTFALFTYISPILKEISGYSASSISWLLLVYGVAVAIGNIIGGN